MSFLFGNAQKAARSKRPLGIDERRTVQHEQGSPVPIWWGTQRIGVTMITEPFNRTVKPASGSKKGGGSSGDNYASVVFALGHGPLDVLRQIWVDEDIWWDGSLTRVEGENSVPITIEDFGSGTLYWGTETQTTDPTLAALGLGHPAYRGIAYMVFPNALLGRSRDTVPHFEVVASRWGLCPEGWAVGPAANGLDVNPMTAVVEVVTNPRVGRGMDLEESINLAGLLSVAATLDNESFSLSPILDTGTTLRQFFADLNEYIDGWHRADDSGLLTWGLTRDSGVWAPVLSEDDMLSEPVIRPGSWVDTHSSVQVVFTNAARYWMREVVIGVDPANAMVTRRLRSPVLERLWITDPSVASKVADVMAQRGGRPWATGSLPLRPSRVEGIAPGDRYRLSYGHWGLLGVPVRVTAVDIGEPGSPLIDVEISFDVGQLNALYSAGPTYVPPDSTALTPEGATYEELWALPSGLGGSDRYPRIALLSAQPMAASGSFAGYVQVSGGAYDPIEPKSTTAFAIRSKAKTATGTTGEFDIELLGLDADLSRFSANDFLRHRIVAYLGQEVIIITSAVLVSAGRYTLSGLRGSYGTEAAAVAVDQAVWLVNHDRLYSHEVAVDSATVVTMKIQPEIRGVGVDLADCAPLAITVGPDDVAPLPPTELMVNGSATPSWSGTDDLLITWTPTEPLGPRAVVLEYRDLAGTTPPLARGDFPVGSVDFLCLYQQAAEAVGGTPVSFLLYARHRVGDLEGPASIITVTRV